MILAINGSLYVVVRLLDDSRQLEASQGRVHAEVEPRYEEVVGVVISVKLTKLVQVEYNFKFFENVPVPKDCL